MCDIFIVTDTVLYTLWMVCVCCSSPIALIQHWQHVAAKLSYKLRFIVWGLHSNTPQVEHCCYKYFFLISKLNLERLHSLPLVPLLLSDWRDRCLGVLALSCSRRGLGHLLHLQHVLHFLGAGGLFVLQQVSVALGHTPGLWCGHGRASWTAGCGREILPVVTTGPRGGKATG